MTSVVLIILALSVRAVSWVDAKMREREVERGAQKQSASDDAAKLEAEPIEDQDDGRARVAAIAVALALSQRQQGAVEPVHETSTQVPANAVYDTWLTEGRARQHARRGATGGRDWQ